MCRQLGTNLVVPGGARIIEAKGRLVMPGMSLRLISFTASTFYSVYRRTVGHLWHDVSSVSVCLSVVVHNERIVAKRYASN